MGVEKNVCGSINLHHEVETRYSSRFVTGACRVSQEKSMISAVENVMTWLAKSGVSEKGACGAEVFMIQFARPKWKVCAGEEMGLFLETTDSSRGMAGVLTAPKK